MPIENLFDFIFIILGILLISYGIKGLITKKVIGMRGPLRLWIGPITGKEATRRSFQYILGGTALILFSLYRLII